MILRLLLLALLLAASPAVLCQSSPSPWGEVFEKDFPFCATVLDAREAGEHPVAENLIPRGIVLKLGSNRFACFDPDLLRIALLWEGEENGFLTENAMGPNSYRIPSQKVPAGQDDLPRPIGEVLAATAVAPGWSRGEPTLKDPRASAASLEEKGLGGLPLSHGRWDALELHADGHVLSYEVGEIPVAERVSYSAAIDAVVRDWEIAQGEESLFIYLAEYSTPPVLKAPARAGGAGDEGPCFRIESGSLSGVAFRVVNHSLFLEVPPRQGEVRVRVSIRSRAFDPDEKQGSGSLAPLPRLDSKTPAPLRWNQTVSSPIHLALEDRGAFVLDDVALPVPNPWDRNVRVADIAFVDEQRAAVVTFDGDVWIASGMGGWSAEVRWSRLASGLHEPKSIVAVDEVLYVFDRTGIVRLLDLDGNGEADRYENFCNLFTQTAETREFAMGMEAHPEGGFVIAKGGQSASTLTAERGSILRIAKDGRSYEVLATGLRQPYPGVDPVSGMVTSSDQQGHFTPATPVHFFDTRKTEFHGFLPNAHPTREHAADAVIAEPPIWIPHAINQSGATQVWMRGSRFPALEGSLLHLGYNKPEVFRVFRDPRSGVRQGGVTKPLGQLPGPVLNGRINPRDGWLYLCGFQIWGGVADRISSLIRVRPGKESLLFLDQALACERGVLLQFNEPIDPAAAMPANFSAERWNYRRTKNYGSPHYRLDNMPGQEFLAVASVVTSSDGRSVFLGIPDMKPSHTLRLSYALSSASGRTMEDSAYLTVHQVPRVDLKGEGFESDEVSLVMPEGEGSEAPKVEPTAAEGKRLYSLMGCAGCHSVAEGDNVKVGPTWKGLQGSERKLVGGEKVIVDRAYLLESILDPTAKVRDGFQKAGVGMPSYLGVLDDSQIDSILLFIESLK